MKTKSPACALCALLTATMLLSACATASSEPKASLQIYQARVLFLEPGVPVPTKEGIYIPQVPETWYPAAAYERLEQQLIDQAAATAQRRFIAPASSQ